MADVLQARPGAVKPAAASDARFNMGRLSALPQAAGSEAPARTRDSAAAWVTAAASAVLVGAVVLTRSAAGSVPFDPSPLLAFDAAKVPAFLRSLAVLAGMNLAAWAVGGVVQRVLGSAGESSLLDPLRRLALGFLALADVVLLLAALHLLRRGLLLVLLLWLAAAGLASLVRRAWTARPRIALAIDAPSAAAGVTVLLMGASVVLGAHMPDYGWDAFTYHLALPERYLFENRIVVSPLFPHSALSLTVEMLYTLALAVDPGPAAKLLHAELGALAAAAVAALAAHHSRRAAALGVLVLAADPLFNWELGVAYSDLGAMLFAVLAVASLQDRLAAGGSGAQPPGGMSPRGPSAGIHFRREPPECGPAALRLCGVFAGASVATRYTAAAVPLAVVAVLWMARIPRRQKLRDSAAIAALCALVLSPWLVRNAIITGNPAAPALQWLFYEPGQEYFDARAMEQQLAFVRLVGFGRGLGDLLALPVNLTLRAREGDYDAFGFRIGPLYVAGLAAALALRHARRSPVLRGLPQALGVLALAWFFTSQEPRYLMPALGLAALAAAVGLDELLRLCAAYGPRALTLLPWLIPLAALAHTQWGAVKRLPYVYGYALGRLSVQAFRSQDPALMIADRLRATLGARDRLFLVYEPRGFFFRDMQYVFANTFEQMQMVHRIGDPDALAAALRRQGVTHVLVNTGNIARYRTIPVPGYGERELDQDLQLLGAMLERHSTLVLADRGVFVRRLAGAAAPEPASERGQGERKWER